MVEPQEGRRRALEELGHAVAAAPEAALRPDVVVDCAGVPEATAWAIGALRPRGTLVVVGYGLVPSFDSAPIARKELSLVGVRSGDRRDLERALELAAAGQIRLPAISRFALEVHRRGLRGAPQRRHRGQGGDRPVKLAVIGAGGFRMPALYTSLLEARERLSIDELALHDTSQERLGLIEPVLEGLEQELGATLPRRASTSLEEVVDGADFIFCAVRAGGVAARLVDESVPVRHGVVGQETTGPGGIAFALRTVPVMQGIAGLIAERAPNAYVVNFTNPAGLVTEAMQHVLGSRVIGICDAPPDLCRRVAEAVGRPREELRFEYAGLNHLAWMTAVVDRGEDLLPALLGDPERLGAMEEGQLSASTGCRPSA